MGGWHAGPAACVVGMSASALRLASFFDHLALIHDDIIARAVAEFNEVLVQQLVVPGLFNFFVVEEGSICALQIHQIRVDQTGVLAHYLVQDFLLSELDDGVLQRNGWILQEHINYFEVSSDQESALVLQLDLLWRVVVSANEGFSCGASLLKRDWAKEKVQWNNSRDLIGQSA